MTYGEVLSTIFGSAIFAVIVATVLSGYVLTVIN